MGVVASVVVAGCTGAAHSTSADRPHSSTTTVSSTTSSTSPPPSTTTTAQPEGPGVLADCTAPAPQHLAVEPTSITVACADAGLGAKDLVWQSWTATAAAGSGEVWENDCTPNCAAGTVKLYPASIALSGVKASRDGPTFTVMTATYSGPQPNGRPADTFTLELPLG